MSHHRYLVHGLVLASETQLPIPVSKGDMVDVAYHVQLDPAPLPPAWHSRDDGTDDPWAVEHWIDARLVVDFPGWATFELSRSDVTLLVDATDDPDLITHLLLDHVMPRVVSLRGDLMLHAAGAVGPSGRAHVFLGPTGAGKSTLATAMAATGWPLLDDDGIRVIEHDGAPHALPGYAGVRLLPDSAAAVLPGVTPGRPMQRGHAKRRFAVDGHTLTIADGPAPIAAIYELQRTKDREPSLTRLALAEALTAIVTQTFHFADEPAAITRKAFEQAAALATAVPVWRLHHPEGLERLAATQALIARRDADQHEQNQQ